MKGGRADELELRNRVRNKEGVNRRKDGKKDGKNDTVVFTTIVLNYSDFRFYIFIARDVAGPRCSDKHSRVRAGPNSELEFEKNCAI